MLRRNCLLATLLLRILIATLAAQSKPDVPDFEVKKHYTKYEYRIAVRDGVHLFTSVYVPKDTSRPWVPAASARRAISRQSSAIVSKSLQPLLPAS